MAKRGYKLQEFLAHSANVNCLSIGKKASRLLVTGGDDCKVNLWAIGKPTSLMSLCGHTSPVESVGFDSSEGLVLAGASSGVIKLWDLQEAKMVRALTGHRSNCSSVEFHPFGEFFASGSMDTDLKIWDIRKKGSIHTYKGHSRGISTIKFTPDGRWVVSGGLDNVVKVWDLTAGKLLHDFKFHEGNISSIDFHPLEFLLATGSSDRTVKFWDLETFELIGSSRPEATGVRSIAFHPDGRTLFCGLDDGLKVYSWEPIVCHDSVDMGWSTLGDFCINEEKLLGCSYYQNSVGIWVADISLIEPYGAGDTDKNEFVEKRFSIVDDHQSSKGIGSGPRRTMSPEYETKEIKNIYIDSAGGNSTAKKAATLSNPKAGDNATGVASRENDIGEDSSDSGRESITFSRTRPGMLLRPAHVRKTPTKSDEPLQSVASQCGAQKKIGSDHEKREPSTQSVFDMVPDKFENVSSPDTPSNEANRMLMRPPRVLRSPNPKNNEAKKTLFVDSRAFDDRKDETEIINKNVTEKSERVPSPEKSCSDLKNAGPAGGNDESNSVKIVRGVKVVSGRTRSLVERFERREDISPTEDKPANMAQAKSDEPPMVLTRRARSTPARVMPVVLGPTVTEPPITSIRSTGTSPARAMTINDPIRPSPAQASPAVNEPPPIASTRSTRTSPARAMPTINEPPPVASTRSARTSPARAMSVKHDQTNNPTSDEPRVASTRPARVSLPRVMRSRHNQANNNAMSTSRVSSKQDTNTTPTPIIPIVNDLVTNISSNLHVNDISNQSEVAQVSGRENESDMAEDLMQTHDMFLSTLQSRLTKLQIVRHFWERNDIKGAIDALNKMSDHSVQADVLSILTDKTEIMKLDLFSQLLPVLSCLLGSRTDRPVNVALEMLLKLVAVFGPVIRATISAPRIVGVDLHAEQRLEMCNSCFVELQKVQKIIPVLARRGGLTARKAQELNLVLQDP